MNKVLYRFIAISSLFFIGYSCSSQNNIEEITSRTGLPIELISHFPEHKSKGLLTTRYCNEPMNSVGIYEPVYIYQVRTNNNSKLVLDSLRAIAKDETVFSDSCNLIPLKFQKDPSHSSFTGREWLYEDWIEKISACPEKHPIPNFIEVGDGEFENKNGISDDYRIFVLESKKGVLYENKLYSDPIPMPDGWEHGYSKGVAINIKTSKIIYWSILW